MNRIINILFVGLCCGLLVEGKRNEQLSVGVITMPAHGHTNPIMILVEEMRLRGHHVSMMTSGDFRSKLESRVDVFYELGNLTSTGLNIRVFGGEKEDFDLLDPFYLFQEIEREFLLHLIPLFKTLDKENNLPDILLIDFLTFGGHDIADIYDIPCVVSFPGIFSPVRYDATWQPESEGGLSFLNRLKGNFLRIPLNLIYYFIYYLSNQVRDEYGLQPWESYMASVSGTSKVTFQFGFAPLVEPGLYLNGVWQLLGVPFKPPEKVELSDEISSWMQDQGDRKLVYVAFGTVAPQSPEFTEYLVNQITKCSSTMDVSFIWSLRDSQRQKNPEALKKIEGNQHILTLPWVNQVAVLQKVDLFFTHGGYNSLSEGVYYGKPMLCMPFSAEQPENCARLSTLQVALTADKKDFSANLCTKIDTLLHDPKYTQEVQKLSEFAKKASKHGVSRAIDTLELVARYGDKPLLPLDYFTPLYIRFDYDITAMYMFLSFITGVLVYKLCCFPKPKAITKTKTQ